jgi:hypothetical protein
MPKEKKNVSRPTFKRILTWVVSSDWYKAVLLICVATPESLI